MSGYRRNSFVVDCSGMPARPKVEKLKDFLFDKLHLTMSNIKNVQTLLTRAQAIIEVESAELVEQIVTQHHLKHSIEHENDEYLIPLFPADNAIEVKVSDLPPHMPNNLVAKYFAPYGEILSIKHETWKDFFPGLPNCVRILRMRLRTAIPSYLAVDGEMAYVMYRNQTRTCRHCTSALHVGRSCADNRKELTNSTSSVNERLTAAQIVQGVTPIPPATASQAPVASSTGSLTTSEQKPKTNNIQSALIIGRKPPQTSSLPTSRSSSASRISNTVQATAPRKTNDHQSSMEFDISDGESDSQEPASNTKRPGSPQLPENSSRSKRSSRQKK